MDSSGNELASALVDAIAHDWSAIARPNSLNPRGDWSTWLTLAGRGFGKTRTGAEWIRANVCGSTPLRGGRYRRIALIAETASDCRDVMVREGLGAGEGSGMMQIRRRHSGRFTNQAKEG